MDLMVFLIVAYMVKIAAEDTWHGIRRTPNPRHAARERRRRTRARSRTWGAVTNYWGDLVEDAAAEATERRRRKAAERKAGVIEAEPGEVEADPDPGDVEPWESEVVHPESWEAPDAAPPGRPEPWGLSQDERLGFWALGPRGCPECGESGEVVQRTDGRTFVHDRTGDLCPKIERDLAQIVKEVQNSGADQPPDDNVIQFPTPKKFNPKESTVSTDVNTEVRNLDTAINYAASVSKFAGEHGMAGNEGYIGYLSDADCAGKAIDTAYAMQEAFTHASEAAAAHLAELEAQKSVQEAYNNNPDAGNKEFLTGGQ